MLPEHPQASASTALRGGEEAQPTPTPQKGALNTQTWQREEVVLLDLFSEEPLCFISDGTIIRTLTGLEKLGF